MTIIPLLWQSPPLSMNDRKHWRSKAVTTAQIRATIMTLARHHNLPRGMAHVTVQLHWQPTDNRRRDTDNLVATLKPICDALAKGTRSHPGYGLVEDDTPQWMAKPEPIIHRATGGEPGRMWIELEWKAIA